ncbi:MAG: D-tyrosyl-tRNA(Tyr) deacylase [Bacilli bacterium]|jgi:D-tyrosyl-tRNA(Tyr) deacylase|nr:D-tyrosyl-tRNA(Tyr) deacylase [Bacilli bacterium]
MRILIQECLKASVTIDSKVVGSISEGEVIFVGFTAGDDERIIDKMIEKLLKLRIFEDENGKTNLNLEAHGGKILCISQFTLYADLSQGNRPSFVNALGGSKSEPLYNYFCKKLSEVRPDTQYGVFGADMKVNLINNGPFTIMLDSKEVIK